MRIRSTWTAVAALALVLLAVPGVAQEQRPAVAPAFSAEDLTAWPTDRWITNGGNIFNQRYSPLTAINRDNVAQLKPKWRASLNGSGTASKYSAQAQPIVYDGVIYVATGANDVFAPPSRHHTSCPPNARVHRRLTAGSRLAEVRRSLRLLRDRLWIRSADV